MGQPQKVKLQNAKTLQGKLNTNSDWYNYLNILVNFWIYILDGILFPSEKKGINEICKRSPQKRSKTKQD